MLRMKLHSKAPLSLQTRIPNENERPLAYLESGTYVLGKIWFNGDAVIEGIVIGDVAAAEKVTVGESGRVTAPIRATSIVVAGMVKGDVIATERIEIRRTARIVGNLTAPILQIDGGAVVEGHCFTRPEQPYDKIAQMGFPFFGGQAESIVTMTGASVNSGRGDA